MARQRDVEAFSQGDVTHNSGTIALVNSPENATPPKFSIRDFGNVSVLGSQTSISAIDPPFSFCFLILSEFERRRI